MNKAELLRKFAIMVREKRTEKGWSQERLGQESNCSTNTIFSVEHAKPTVPRTRAKVAKALGIDLP
jgi:ribosome-binding protein aMBF1 (putative translation factor)